MRKTKERKLHDHFHMKLNAVHWCCVILQESIILETIEIWIEVEQTFLKPPKILPLDIYIYVIKANPQRKHLSLFVMRYAQLITWVTDLNLIIIKITRPPLIVSLYFHPQRTQLSHVAASVSRETKSFRLWFETLKCYFGQVLSISFWAVLFGDRSEILAHRLHWIDRAYDRHYKFKPDTFSFGHSIDFKYIFYGTLNNVWLNLWCNYKKRLKSHSIVLSNFY